MARNEILPSNQMGCQTLDSSVDERAFRPLLDGRFVASATRELGQVEPPARLRARNRSAGKRQLVWVSTKSGQHPSLRSPLSRKSFGDGR